MKVNYWPRPNSPYWWIRYTPGPNMPQVRESTGIRHEGRKTPPKDSPIWELIRNIEDRAMRQKFGLQATIIQAPIDEFFTRFQNSLTGRRGTTLVTYQGQCNGFVRWCQEQKLAVVADITSTRAMEFIDSMKARCASATVRSTVAVLKMALDDAKKRNHIAFEENPFKVRIKVEATKEKPPFTRDEIVRLKLITEPAWLPIAIRIAHYTGARCGSICAVLKENVRFDLGTIYFHKGKTKPYAEPMHPDLVEYLRPLAENQTGPLFPELEGKAGSYFATMFARRAKEVGVTGSFHQLRHTFITLCAESGVDKRIAQLLANHASGDIHDHYTHVDAAKLAGEILKVNFG